MREPRGRLRFSPKLLLVLSDALAFCGGVYLSLSFLPMYDAGWNSTAQGRLHFLLSCLPLAILLLGCSGLYHGLHSPWPTVLRRSACIQVLELGGLLLLLNATKAPPVAYWRALPLGLSFFPFSVLGRQVALAVWDAHSSHIYNVPHILIIGSGGPARVFVRHVKRFEDFPHRFVGCLHVGSALAPTAVEGVPVLGTAEILRNYVFLHPVDVVVIATPLVRSEEVTALLSPVFELGITVWIVPESQIQVTSSDRGNVQVGHKILFETEITVLLSVPARKAYLFCKRISDVLISAILLVFLSPLFLLIAVLVKINSPQGPVFYAWHVLGKNGKPFVGYKFRTMMPRADQLKQQLLAFNEMQGPIFKMRNDPRVTPLGRFLRKFSLDELPQLYSVLKGDMSLVGPRPPFPQEAEGFEFWQRRKLSVKPGITCLWQINGRNEIFSFDEWARLDLEYIDTASFLLDVKILLRTIPAVLFRRGAY
jgi:exopolysaccharide biosynthesis polyprenyl glycosylphosphotransferase